MNRIPACSCGASARAPAILRLPTLAGFLVLAGTARGEHHTTIVSRADAAYRSGDFARAAELYVEATSTGAPGASARLSAACCYARSGRKDEAFAWLEKAIAAGWRDGETLRANNDLRPLHADPRWEKTIERFEIALAEYIKSLKEPALREDLLRRMKADQQVRLTATLNAEEMSRIDAENTVFMKSVVDRHGWPGRSMVGSDGELAAFVLVQHATLARKQSGLELLTGSQPGPDVPFQKKCLELLSAAVKQNDAPAVQLAYLTDRVLVYEHKPQRYGTHFESVNGEMRPLAIEDEANVDARREEVGLAPLAEYTKQMRETQRP